MATSSLSRFIRPVGAGFRIRLLSGLLAVAGVVVLTVQSPVAVAQDKPVYKCPGNLYTDALSPREAVAKGCKTLEGAPITIIQAVRPRPAVKSGADSAPASVPKVSQGEQKARDADSRQILEAELKKEEEALAALRKEYNNGQPERRGDERQASKYNERVQSMKDAITRKEADVASIRRELAKLGVSPPPSAPARVDQ